MSSLSTLLAYCDADWAADPDTRRSITGYCVFFNDCLISWSSNKQRTVSRSSADSEYRSMAAVTADLTWIRQLLPELMIKTAPADIRCDNQSAIKLSFNPIFHARSKRIEIDHHFIHEKVERGEIVPTYVPSKDQLADILRKSLA